MGDGWDVQSAVAIRHTQYRSGCRRSRADPAARIALWHANVQTTAAGDESDIARHHEQARAANVLTPTAIRTEYLTCAKSQAET